MKRPRPKLSLDASETGHRRILDISKCSYIYAYIIIYKYVYTHMYIDICGIQPETQNIRKARCTTPIRPIRRLYEQSMSTSIVLAIFLVCPHDLEAMPALWHPKGHINVRILHSGSRAHMGDSRSHVLLVSLCFYGPSGPWYFAVLCCKSTANRSNSSLSSQNDRSPKKGNKDLRIKAWISLVLVAIRYESRNHRKNCWRYR